MKYKILGTIYGEDPIVYIEMYSDMVSRCHTNRDILDVFKFKTYENLNTDLDLIVVQEIDETFIELQEKCVYSIFSKDDNTYKIVSIIHSEQQYNDVLTNYNGDHSSLVLCQIIKDNFRGIQNI